MAKGAADWLAAGAHMEGFATRMASQSPLPSDNSGEGIWGALERPKDPYELLIFTHGSTMVAKWCYKVSKVDPKVLKGYQKATKMEAKVPIK